MVPDVALDRGRTAEVAARVSAALVQSRVLGDAIRFTLPVLYPSGQAVGVKVMGGPTTFLVTDDGGAAREADFMGASALFARQARKVAETHGVRFNSHEIFEVDAALDRLPGFVALVADASRMAAQMTVDRFGIRLEADTKMTIADRVGRAFGVAAEPNAKLMGASTHEWTFDAAVTLRDRTFLFSVVSPHANSVSAAYLRWDDVRRIEHPPERITVLTDRRAFGSDQLVILNRASKLFDARQPDDLLKSLAA